ncbi:ferritin-like domain-containing protein [bacterium]|nr:MAG: ferritin-like domain-containing protein [bacterium]
MSNQLEDVSLAASDNGVKSPARRQFFALATAVGGVALAGALYKPAQADIVASLGKIFYLDPTVLNFAFAIEELEADFFSRSFRTAGFQQLNGPERAAFSLFANQDESHRMLLESLRGPFNAKDAGTFESLNTSASRRPRLFYYPPLGSREELLKTALDIKENALFTYHGAVGLVKNKKLLGVAASIAGVEGRHVAVLRDMMGLDPVPAPFEGAITAALAGRKFAAYGLKGGAPQ